MSFFTGGGFLDLGFTQAGFKVCWTNENNPAIIEGYEYGISSWLSSVTKRNRATVKISNTCDVCDLSPRKMLTEAFCGPKPHLFGLIGGPPCPDFSNGGTHAGGNGLNGQLTTVFTDIICGIRPSFFVIENVPGLIRFRKHREFFFFKIFQLQLNGYAVDYTILNSLELGVPQDRERLFVVGFKKPLADLAVERKLLTDERDWFPWPRVARYDGAKLLDWPRVNVFRGRPRKPRGIPLELTVYPSLIGNGNPEEIANGCDFFNPYSDKFTEIKEGDVSRKSFKRLHRYRFSPTAWYGNQEVHLHPWKPRRLSVREALRIQSVPDEYILPAHLALSTKFKLTCNGVPCLMAYHLAKAIMVFLKRLI